MITWRPLDLTDITPIPSLKDQDWPARPEIRITGDRAEILVAEVEMNAKDYCGSWSDEEIGRTLELKREQVTRWRRDLAELSQQVAWMEGELKLRASVAELVS